ncbi:MAG: hypothetical protein G8345_14865 [Magnetococcales bacterium]|nr:patatin-like phospholipase family protein [Magnetococcales bacterium]NGZ28159.1 hypothetical protein [Magnetococcales bacterium]
MKYFSVLSLALVFLVPAYSHAEIQEGAVFPYKVTREPDKNKSSYNVYFPYSTLCSDKHTPEAAPFPNTQLQDHLKESTSYKWGLALAGGGSKAASFNMGILTGLSRNKSKNSPSTDQNLLANLDILSTVSGGSYAAFYYYSRLLNANYFANNKLSYLFTDDFPGIYLNEEKTRKPNNTPLPLDQYFNYPETSPSHTKAGEYNGYPEKLWNQKYIRFHQDVLQPLTYSSKMAEGDFSPYVNAAGLILLSLTTAPLHYFNSMVFDWPEGDSSPTRNAYLHGIANTYGLIPNNNHSYCYDNNSIISELNKDNQTCPRNNANGYLCEYFSNTTDNEYNYYKYPDRSILTFSHLDKLYENKLAERNKPDTPRTIENNVPFWVINATSPAKRNLAHLLLEDPASPACNTFEFTSKGFGSGQFGFVNAPFDTKLSPNYGSSNEYPEFDIYTAVGASAAFLDANEMAIEIPAGKFIAGSFLHLFNANWGTDIINYNISAEQRAIHKMLPFPLYLFDSLQTSDARADSAPSFSQNSPYIRLVDGGNAENLGAYALIRRGVENIIISDASFDGTGWMEDICNLGKNLENDHQLHLQVPGLKDLKNVCNKAKRMVEKEVICKQEYEERCLTKTRYLPYHYPIHQWKYPILAGCVTKDKNDVSCQKPLNKLLIIKPVLSDQLLREHAEDAPETVGYVNLKKKADDVDTRPGKCSVFPQHGTVSMTFNSDSLTYGAYKDLGSYYASKIPWEDQNAFAKMIGDQSADGIEPVVGTPEEEKCDPNLYANMDNVR